MSYLQDLLGDAYKDGMTTEEIETALQTANIGKPVEPDTSALKKLQEAYNKASSEAANYKKQLREHQSTEEATAAEQKSLMEKLTQENEEYKKAISVSTNKASLLALGYDDKLASETAEAMFNGDMASVIKNQQAYLVAHDKAIKAEQLKATPTPAVGGNASAGTGMTLEALRKMSAGEQMKFATEHQEEYTALYKENS